MITETKKHTEGCRAGWRITGCEKCERRVTSYDSLVAVIKKAIEDPNTGGAMMFELQQTLKQAEGEL